MSCDTFIDQWYKIDMALFRRYETEFCVGSTDGMFGEDRKACDFYLSSFRNTGERSKGNATKALKLLCKLALRHGVSIILECGPSWNGKENTVREWSYEYWRVMELYRRCGFRIASVGDLQKSIDLRPAHMVFNRARIIQ